MVKQLIPSIILIVLAICPNQLCAQHKYESESRLKEENVPTKALDFIQSLAVENKIKWYEEEGLNRTTIEAKFKLNNQKYSVEFDSVGNLEDIEILLEWKGLHSSLQDSICIRLGEDCDKIRIQKAQIQYSGEPSVLLSKIKTGKNTGSYLVRYELIVKCYSKKKVALFEYLFSDTGQKLSVAKIVFKNSSNLEY